jgi:hypothetical protein
MEDSIIIVSESTIYNGPLTNSAATECLSRKTHVT